MLCEGHCIVKNICSHLECVVEEPARPGGLRAVLHALDVDGRRLGPRGLGEAGEELQVPRGGDHVQVQALHQHVHRREHHGRVPVWNGDCIGDPFREVNTFFPLQGVPCAHRLGFVDLDLECSTVCLTLLGLMGIWQKRLGSWARRWNQISPVFFGFYLSGLFKLYFKPNLPPNLA